MSNSEEPKEPQEPQGVHRDDLQRVRRVRIACTVEFILANVVSIALAVLVLIRPDLVTTLRTVWWVIALPAMIGAIGLLIFHARVVHRPARFWAVELATWVVFPLAALGGTFLIPTAAAA